MVIVAGVLRDSRGADNGPVLLRRDPERGLALDLRQTLGQALAFRIDQSGGSRTGNRIGCARRWDLARQRRPDQPGLDDAIVAEAARISIAIAFDQPGAFRDFERKACRKPRRLYDQAEPGFDLLLLCLLYTSDAADE